MAADPQLVEATNKIATTVLTTVGPIILIAGIIGIIVAIIRRNTGEAVNRFFWRRNKTGRKCPLDGGTLVKRRGKYGPFVGCSNYPRCRYTEGGIKE